MPGCGNTQLRGDDMRDALIAMMPADVRQREFRGVLVEHLDHAPNFRIGHAGPDRAPAGGRQVMVGHRKMLMRAASPASLDPKLVERQKGLTFVDQVEIDVKEVFALRRHTIT